MSVTADSFRQSFGAVFLDAGVYPDQSITFWIGVATLMLPQRRWGIPSPTADVPPTKMIDLGTLFYVAHQLVLEKQSADAAKRGGTPGVQKGAISGDSVGQVSRNYNSAAGLELEAGHWNLTTYGTRFVQLANIVGLAPVTVGGSPCFGPQLPPSLSLGGFGGGGSPWIGPPPWPGWFG